MAKAFLSHLEQFSLLHSTEDNQYYLLESVRAYASEKATDFLTEARMQHLTARHAKYFASRAVSLFPSILVEGGGERLPERLTEMERRLPDMRFALQTLAKEQEWESLSLLSSSLLAFSLLRIVYATDILSLVQERFDKMQEIPSAAEAYADLRIDLARVAISRGQLDYGLSLCQEQIRLSIDSTDPNERRREAPARECSTVAFAYARQFDTAKAEGEEALRLFVAQGDTVGEARACHTLVNICRSMNRDEEGIHFGERSIALSRRSNRLHDVARTLSAIALPYWFGRQDKETAYAVAHEALELNRCLGLQGREVISLRVLADVCATTGDVSGGERYARQALRLARQLDRNGFEEAMSYKVLGCAVLKQNRPVQAMRFLCRAVVLLLSGNVISQVAEILYYVVEAMGIGAGINRDMLPKIRNARQELLNPNASQCERDATLATVREFAQTNELLISE